MSDNIHPEAIYRLRVIGRHRVLVPSPFRDNRYLFKPDRVYRMSGKALRLMMLHLHEQAEDANAYASLLCQLAIDRPGGPDPFIYEGQSFAQAVAEAGGVPVDKLHHSSYAKMVGFDELLTEAFNTVVKLNDELYARIRRVDSPLFSLWATGVACAINYGEQCVWCSENDDRELTGRCECVVYDDPDPEECGPRDDCTNCGGDGRVEPQESIETYVRRAVLLDAKLTIEGLG